MLQLDPQAAAPSAARPPAARPPVVGDRLARLLDPGTFREMHGGWVSLTAPRPTAGDGVVVGFGEVHGQRVFVFAQDVTVMGGSIGVVHAEKLRRLVELADRAGAPVVGLFDGGGARIQEGVRALAGCGALFAQIVRSTGSVPQVSVILGSCAGAAAYAPALTDFVFMVNGTSAMYLTGPDVVEQVTGEHVDSQELGGAQVHGSRTGLADFVHDDEESCLEDVRYLVSLLPPSGGRRPERAEHAAPESPDPGMRSVVPADRRVPYDVRDVVLRLLDPETYLEVHESWGRSIVCGFGRLAGRTVGVVANQPVVLAGAINAEAAQKAARFVRTCNRYAIPLLTLVDVPGFMPGVEQEHGGVIRSGAELLRAYCEATVPRIQVILRKAYGGAYIVMDSLSVGADLSYSWPATELAVMGAEGAVKILYRRELSGGGTTRECLTERYREEQLHPAVGLETGMTYQVLDPADTRLALVEGLSLLEDKRRGLV